MIDQTGHQRPGVLHLHKTGTPDVTRCPPARPDRWASPRENLTGATWTGARLTRWKVTFQDES